MPISLTDIIDFLSLNPQAQFPKFRNEGSPYQVYELFLTNNPPYFRYRFLKNNGAGYNVKRLFLNEVIALLTASYVQAQSKFHFSRDLFEKHCSNSLSDGTCGYCVAVRLVESIITAHGIQITVEY